MGLGFGIIGVGMIAGFHARAIREMGGGRLVACCDIDRGRAEAFAGAQGCSAYADLAAFLRHPGLDIVNICTPSGLHLEPALAAIEAGKHVLIEKPIEISLERIDRIIEAADRRRVTVAGIFQSRFRPGAQAVKSEVEAGRFGRLVLADAYVKWFRSQDYYDKGGWKGKIRIDGGGALMNQSIHAIDLLQWFMGPVASVQAYKDRLAHERIEVEDVAVAAVRFANGALGVIEGSTAVYPGFLKRIELSGTSGSVVLEEDSIRTWSFVDEQPRDAEIRRTPRRRRLGGRRRRRPRSDRSRRTHARVPGHRPVDREGRAPPRRRPRGAQVGGDHPGDLQERRDGPGGHASPVRVILTQGLGAPRIGRIEMTRTAAQPPGARKPPSSSYSFSVQRDNLQAGFWHAS